MLSQITFLVMKEIAQGKTYEQILARHPNLTYLDIFAAAQEVLDEANSKETAEIKPAGNPDKNLSYAERLNNIHQKHPRAYESWEAEEDAKLTQLYWMGQNVTEMAQEMERQPGAIRSRLRKLKLG